MSTTTPSSPSPSLSPSPSPSPSPLSAGPPAPNNEKSLETRFGLVMYGGVSLAIYINGVCHELSRAVRGNGVYRLLKQLADTDVAVDIMSGSSAGGINGIFLAYALANGKDFGPMAQLWRDLADVQKLLWPVETPPEACTSLFNSDGFYQNQLYEALEKLPVYRPAPMDDPTPPDEIDLFVTGTDVAGNVYTTVDEDGHTIDVKDHRRVFLLKHRPSRTNARLPFEPNEGTYQSLARLARITSCFPGAFSPVCVTGQDDSAPGPVDGALRGWGQFTKKTYLLDGGVLNNKPFTHTFRAICSRPADRPVSRQLCYVEPDPDYFPERAVQAPSFFSAVLGGAFGIKGYESIADDLKMIADHNAQVERYWQVCRNLRGTLPRWSYAAVESNGVVLPGEETLFALNRATAGAAADPALRRDPPRVPTFFSTAVREQYGRSRLGAMGARALRGALKDSTTGEDVPIGKELRERVSALIADLHDRAPDGNRVLAVDESLFRFDVYFRQRRLQHVICKIAKAIGREPDPAHAATLRALSRDLNDHAQVAEILGYWIEYVLDRAQIDWQDTSKSPHEIWNAIRWSMEELLVVVSPQETFALPALSPAVTAETDDQRTAREAGNRSQLAAFYQRLHDRAKAICALDANHPRPMRATFHGLLADADLAAYAAFAHPRYAEETEFRDELAEYAGLDAMVYPLELVSGLASKEAIKILRISPRDAETAFCDRKIGEKIAGKALAHFGGFFKRSWRSNDILWGRLDALCELTENLLTSERLRDVAGKDALRAKVRGRFVGRGSIAQLFPRSDAAIVGDVHGWVTRLLDDDPAAREQALAQLGAMRALIIEMAQLELISECVPQVVEDAALEQQTWNQYAVPVKARTGKSSDAVIEKQVRAVIAAAAAQPPDEETLADACLRAAELTHRDAQRTKEICARVAATDARLRAIWAEPDPVRANTTTGDRLVDQAMRASYRADVRRQLEGRDSFQATRGFVDPAVAATAAAEYARASLEIIDGPAAGAATPGLRPWDSPLGRFFRQKYAVGSEDLWRDIPWLVLIEIFAHAALILRQCVTQALPPDLRERVRKHVLYRFAFELPLRSTYWIIQFARQASATFQVVAGVVAALALSVLGLTFWRRDVLLMDAGHVSFKSIGLLVVAPVLVLWLLLTAIQNFARRRYVIPLLKRVVWIGIVAAFAARPVYGWVTSLGRCLLSH